MNCWDVKIVALKPAATKNTKTAITSTKAAYPIAAVKQISNQAKPQATPEFNLSDLLANNQKNTATISTIARFKTWGAQKWNNLNRKPAELQARLYAEMLSNETPQIASNYERDGEFRGMGALRYLKILAAPVSKKNSEDNVLEAFERFSVFYSGLRRKGYARPIFLQLSLKLIEHIQQGPLAIQQNQKEVLFLLDRLTWILEHGESILSKTYYEINYGGRFPEFKPTQKHFTYVRLNQVPDLNAKLIQVLTAPLIGVKKIFGTVPAYQLESGFAYALSQLEIQYGLTGSHPEAERSALPLDTAISSAKIKKPQSVQASAQKPDRLYRLNAWMNQRLNPWWESRSLAQKIGTQVTASASIVAMLQIGSNGLRAYLQANPQSMLQALPTFDFTTAKDLVALSTYVMGSFLFAGHKCISRANLSGFKPDVFFRELTTAFAFIVLYMPFQALLGWNPILMTIGMMWWSGWTSVWLGVLMRDKTRDQVVGAFDRPLVSMLASNLIFDPKSLWTQAGGKLYRSLFDLVMYVNIDMKEVFFQRWQEMGWVLNKIQNKHAAKHIDSVMQSEKNLQAISALMANESGILQKKINQEALKSILLQAHTALSLQFLMLKGRAKFMLGQQLKQQSLDSKKAFHGVLKDSVQLLSNPALMKLLIGILKVSDRAQTQTAHEKYLQFSSQAITKLQNVASELEQDIKTGEAFALATRRPAVFSDYNQQVSQQSQKFLSRLNQKVHPHLPSTNYFPSLVIKPIRAMVYALLLVVMLPVAMIDSKRDGISTQKKD